MIIKSNRLRELDFLRGVAIILVLLNHQYLFEFTRNIGWIGVDLFFVLSGFLVSGLLFKEYLKFGTIKPGLFLIRRGFKIYPIYYLFYILYLKIKLIRHDFSLRGVFYDLIFVQNYFLNWSYAFVPSWSLAVEEHFYFGFAFILWFAIKKKSFNSIPDSNFNTIGKFEKAIVIIMVSCLCLRILSNIYFPEDFVRNTTKTHLRIDSLLAGVFVAYLYYFKNTFLNQFFLKNKKKLLFLSLLFVSFSPFLDHLHSFFVKTIGFTFLYISFAIMLIYFLMETNINAILNKYFTNRGVNFISKIGYSSYSIYIIHVFINYIFGKENAPLLNQTLNHYIMFFITFVSSVIVGIFMTNYIEKYFLGIRDKFYPSRIG